MVGRPSGAASRRALEVVRQRPVPALALGGIGAGLLLRYALGRPDAAAWVLLATLVLGGLPIVAATVRGMLRGRFATDVVATLAIVGALLTGEYLAGAVIVLMQSGGEALEAYGVGAPRRRWRPARPRAAARPAPRRRRGRRAPGRGGRRRRRAGRAAGRPGAGRRARRERHGRGRRVGADRRAGPARGRPGRRADERQRLPRRRARGPGAAPERPRASTSGSSSSSARPRPRRRRSGGWPTGTRSPSRR